MAAVAAPLIELVVARVLLALGIGLAAEQARREMAKKRNEEADKAKSAPIAQAGTQEAAKEKCKDCSPDKGGLVLQPRAGWGPIAVAYQIRIAQMPSGPPGYLTEWMFGGVKFDGFDSRQCLLKEAKATYDQFFNECGEFRYEFQERIFIDMMGTAVKQNLVAVPKPPVSLRWYFMEPISYRYMQRILQAAAPQIEVVFQP
jgi:hypothetical protein